MFYILHDCKGGCIKVATGAAPKMLTSRVERVRGKAVVIVSEGMQPRDSKSGRHNAHGGGQSHLEHGFESSPRRQRHVSAVHRDLLVCTVAVT